MAFSHILTFYITLYDLSTFMIVTGHILNVGTLMDGYFHLGGNLSRRNTNEIRM
jgi:hypothetical protein